MSAKSQLPIRRALPGDIRRNRLLVISMDSLGAEDVPLIESLPNFKRLLAGASYCYNVSSVYPSLTYPAHTSIITGCYPRKHGIVNNTRIQVTKDSPDWYWQRKYIKTNTVYDAVLKRKGKVASLLWPVTARSKITWNMPEIFSNHRFGNQILTSISNGSTLYQATLQQKFGYLRKGIQQPALDDFVTESVKYTMTVLNPDLTLVHLADLDVQRHMHGAQSPEAKEAILRHDRRLGEILDVLESNGSDINTNLIVLGDHYQKDTSKAIQINYYFVKKGWITLRKGQIHEYEVYCKNTDGSAYVYIKKNHGYLRDAVRELLMELANDADSGVEQVIEGRDAAAMGADPRCSFMLEARDGYYFLDGYNAPEVEVDAMTEGLGRKKVYATHGYLPGKPGYQTIFIAKGPDIVGNVEIPSMCLVDEGPTMARLLRVSLPDTDGRVIRSILK